MARKLLLADDSVTIQKVVGISFANEDVELVTVDNGDDAIAKAREIRPDVVLADVVMPGKNGYEVCEALHADAELAGVPVLLLTGTFEAFDEERAERCGAVGHLAKPFEAQALVERVRELLERGPAAASGGSDPGATVAIGRIGLEPASAPAVESAADDAASFDFFDESAGDVPAEATALDLDTADDPFAFAMGELDLPGDGDDALAGTQLITEPEPAGDALDVDFAIGLDAASASSDPRLADLVAADGGGADLFDFGDDEMAGDDGDDFGQQTVLDPHGASGYDIGAADMGAAEAAPVGLGDDDPLFGEADAAPAALPSLDDSVLEVAPPASAEIEIGGDADETPAVTVLVDSTPESGVDFDYVPPLDELDADDEPVAPTALESEPFAIEADPLPDPLDMDEALVEAEPMVAAEPEAEWLGIAGDPAPAAEPTAGQLDPALRAAVHDTLEKIAWEALGNVAEQVIAQAVERIERAAWEVIPQMAETLIREEIRRMKGGE